MPISASARYRELSDLIRASCWSEGYEAPVDWVHWLLDLELAALAERLGVTVDEAVALLPLAEATTIGEGLVDVSRQMGGGPKSTP